MAERALDLMIDRVNDPRRTTFGKMLVEHGAIRLIFLRMSLTINLANPSIDGRFWVGVDRDGSAGHRPLASGD